MLGCHNWLERERLKCVWSTSVPQFPVFGVRFGRWNFQGRTCVSLACDDDQQFVSYREKLKYLVDIQGSGRTSKVSKRVSSRSKFVIVIVGTRMELAAPPGFAFCYGCIGLLMIKEPSVKQFRTFSYEYPAEDLYFSQYPKPNGHPVIHSMYEGRAFEFNGI